MSKPKGKVPAHIKPKKFYHPAESNRLVLVLSEKDGMAV